MHVAEVVIVMRKVELKWDIVKVYPAVEVFAVVDEVGDP